ncbi:unnamed protein product [Periconia digitata]|uniref:BZIP domain-containing protein n=1 Tax=Periconia digitata TaxID=1303443 RepID=A0A9W4UX83_9PLEO|nr:unnamed protein product [Periconia digitata]
MDDTNNSNRRIDTPPPTYDSFTYARDIDLTPVAHSFNDDGIYAFQTGFTALNTPNSGLETRSPETVTPLQLSFEIPFSSPSFSTETAVHSASSSTFDSILASSIDPSSTKRRRHSTWTAGRENPSSSSIAKTTGRRQKSENAEPGSARAIYLEKNRKAASKCRGKQRIQQQELVDTAREMGSKNKQLKRKVESLKSDMRNLMMIAGQHSNCPDRRLKIYVQREADRLIFRKTTSAKTLATDTEAIAFKNSHDIHPSSQETSHTS